MMMPISKFIFIAIDYIFDKAQNPPKFIKKTRPHVYCEREVMFDKRNPDQKLDYYFVPQSYRKYPVIVEIHGGGFSAGDKKYRTALSYYFAKKTGAFVVNVDYGLGRDYIFPEPVQHLVRAMNWIYDNADRFNLDINKVLVTGDSAGGYYSSLLACYQKNTKLQKICGESLKLPIGALATDCGIYDLEMALKTKVIFNLTKEICLDFSGVTPDAFSYYKYRDAVCPLDFVDADFPKSLIIYADQDVFCGGQGQKLIQQLKSVGVYVESYGSHKFLDNHTFPLTWESKAAQEANKRLIDFCNNFFNDKI